MLSKDFLFPLFDISFVGECLSITFIMLSCRNLNLLLMSFIMFTFSPSLRPLNFFIKFFWSKCFKSLLCGLNFFSLRTDKTSTIRKLGKWSKIFLKTLPLLYCKSKKFRHILSVNDSLWFSGILVGPSI